MIMKKNYNNVKSIIEIILETMDDEISIDTENIGIFEMGNFKEIYGNNLGNVYKCIRAGYLLLEIHRSQVGEIEALYDSQDINAINIVYDDYTQERYITQGFATMRITSTGDLRIETGEIPEELEIFNEEYINYEHSPYGIFGRYWDKDGVLMIEEEPIEKLGNSYGASDHSEIIEDNRNKLKDFLGEIVESCGNKRISKEKLIILASLVDLGLQYAELGNFNVFKHTMIFADGSAENYRIKKLKANEYTGRNLEDTEIKNVIKTVCDEYKNLKINQLRDKMEEAMELYTEQYEEFEKYEKKESLLSDEEVEKSLEELDKLFEEFDNKEDDSAADDFQEAPFD